MVKPLILLPFIALCSAASASDIAINLYGAHAVREGENAHYRLELDLAPTTKAGSKDELLNILNSLSGKGILFGQQHAIDESVSGDDVYGRQSDVAAMTGKYPAVFGFDSDEEPTAPDKMPTENGKALARAFVEADTLGAMVTLSSHLKNPLSGRSAFDIENKVDVKRLLKNGDLNHKITDWLDTVASAAHESVRADGSKVPIIFRPLHEHTGDWFWWGERYMPPEDFKKLWRYIHDYLSKEKGVDNLLFAFSPNGHFNGDKAQYLAAYPGDDYVDIMGYDVYQSDNHQTDKEWIAATIKDLAMLSRIATEHGKVPAFTEFGLNHERVIQRSGNQNIHFFSELISAIQANREAANIAYMMTWANWGIDENGEFQSYTPWPGHEMEADFKAFAQKLLLSKVAEKNIIVELRIEHQTTDNRDIKANTRQLTILKGKTGADFNVKTLQDRQIEGDEIYSVKIISTKGVTIRNGSISTIIHDSNYCMAYFYLFGFKLIIDVNQYACQ